ncbi:MAG: hypothetical protein AAF805_01610 [Planctomycetota bacterium]
MRDVASSVACAAAAFVALAALLPGRAAAEDVSQEAILQVFEAEWDTIERRMPDIFRAGYGRMWVPPPQRADSGGFSVGYDVFDRFDLGSPRNETLYGTEQGLKDLVKESQQAGLTFHTDFIINHNGFSDRRTFDGQGTVTTSDDVTFEQSGGYPGFVTSAPGTPYGDFHVEIDVNDNRFLGRLAGLIDIDHTLNLQYIRTPVDPGDPQNIPAGTQGLFGRPPSNVPTPTNARFYPDRDAGGIQVNDPALGGPATLYDFNTADPMTGDAVPENALGLILRNARWMVQEVGVDGFRLDAVRHFEQFVLNFFDQSVFRASQRTYLDGTPRHAFTFSETGGDGNLQYLQDFIRKDIDNNDLGTVGGNRDALDFNLFFTIKDNLSGNGIANDWRTIKNSSIDANDGFHDNGSQGVAFVRSHDDGPAYLDSVAHAYMLMRPGEAIVYFNAKEFGENRDFPQNGRGDALGGVYGDEITTLVNLRNTHGRGNYADRSPLGDEKETLIFEREKSAVTVLSNRLDAGWDEYTVQTAFDPGTRLVELTGNADNPTIDPGGELANVLIVDGAGQITVRAPHNASQVPDGNGGTTLVEHRQGYLIYGVAGPQGRMTFTDPSDAPLTGVVAGSTPTLGQGGANGPSDDFFNGQTRLADLHVVTGDSFRVRVETDAVSYDDGTGTPYRDTAADGDFAVFKINDGVDANGSGAVDFVTPDSVVYAFENFNDVNQPGFGSQTGDGLYVQTVDATQLAEGEHYVTGRVFRARNPAGGGDGGPAVYTDFREVIYVDRLPPEQALVSFDAFVTGNGNPDNRDLVVASTDGTAERMHVFLDLPATMTEAQILQMVDAGQGEAGYYDSDEFAAGFFGVTSGNHTATVVAVEPTGNFSVERYVGLSTDTNVGRGIGDLDADNIIEAADIVALEALIAGENAQFNAAADATGDGLIDTRDLIVTGDALLAGSGAAAKINYERALERRADLNGDGNADAADLAALYDNAGSADLLYDINVDGVTDALDAELLVTALVRTVAGDFNLDGVVDAADYTVWRDAEAAGVPSLLADGDFDGDVDAADYDVFAAAFGFVRGAFGAPSATAIPEPTGAVAAAAGALTLGVRRRRRPGVSA